MSEVEKDDFAGDEAYHNAYFYFHKALTVLAQDADEQCEVFGYVNVAWELKNDILGNGRAVLNTVDKQLSCQQKNEIIRLLANIVEIPDFAVKVPNSTAAQLQVMNDSWWVRLRTQAKHLLSLLKAETIRVNAALNINSS